MFKFVTQVQEPEHGSWQSLIQVVYGFNNRTSYYVSSYPPSQSLAYSIHVSIIPYIYHIYIYSYTLYASYFNYLPIWLAILADQLCQYLKCQLCSKQRGTVLYLFTFSSIKLYLLFHLLSFFTYMFTRDFSSFDIMLLLLKLQTCFVLPGLIRTITYVAYRYVAFIFM